MIALMVLPLNTRTMQIIKTTVLFVFFFENLTTPQSLQSTGWHFFFLKLNSDNNILLMFVFTCVILFRLYKLFTGLLIFFFIEVLLPSNNYNIYFFIDSVNLNTQLTNGLLLIHPLFLYFFTSMVIVFFLFKINVEKITHIYFFKKKKTTRLIQLITATTLLFSIFLGSWWAQLELSWGGWWGWDFIEIISLNYLILLLLMIHSRSSTQDNYFISVDTLIKLIFFIVVVKFNYLESVHNFVSLDFFLQNFYQLLFLYILFIYGLKTVKLRMITIRAHKNIKKQLNFIFITFWVFALYFYIFVVFEFFLIFFQNIGLNLFYKNKLVLIVVLSTTLALLNIFKIIPITLFKLTFWEIKYFLLTVGWKKEVPTFSFHVVLIGLIYILYNNVLFYNFIQFSTNYSNILITIVDNCYNNLFDGTQTVSFTRDGTELLYQNTYVIDKCVLKSTQGYNLLEQTKQQQTTLYINLMTFVLIFLIFIITILYTFRLQKYLFKLKWEKL